MAFYINFSNPNSPEMIHELEQIPACPGTCFFMDINRSTDIKYAGGLKDWGRRLNNTFNVLLYTNHFQDYVVKGIGDEIMLFIPDSELKKKENLRDYYGLLEDIFASLFIIKNHTDDQLFLNCKVAIHYCTSVYNITFFKGAEDYYGSDIDLTARLMSQSRENRIVMSERFYQHVQSDLLERKLPPDEGCLRNVSGRKSEHFKGVPQPTAFRTIDIG
jgi:class 3 adenylate cyclase